MHIKHSFQAPRNPFVNYKNKPGYIELYLKIKIEKKVRQFWAVKMTAAAPGIRSEGASIGLRDGWTNKEIWKKNKSSLVDNIGRTSERF